MEKSEKFFSADRKGGGDGRGKAGGTENPEQSLGRKENPKRGSPGKGRAKVPGKEARGPDKEERAHGKEERFSRKRERGLP